jgi:lysozyme family protein
MAASNREACIKITLKYEGGYTNHPSDPGGPTNWGITIHDAKKYWKAGATAADVKAMPLSVAIDIYRMKYWTTSYFNCDRLSPGVDLAVFDFGVNSGPSRAKRYLDAAVGGTAVETVKRICKARLSFVQGLKTWSVFGVGWGRRIADVEARGVKMALQAQHLPQEEVTKELEREKKKAEEKANKHGTGAGTGTAGGAGGATQLPDMSNLDLSTQIGLAFAGVVVTGLVVWFVWHWWQNRQRAKAYAVVAKERK